MDRDKQSEKVSSNRTERSGSVASSSASNATSNATGSQGSGGSQGKDASHKQQLQQQQNFDSRQRYPDIQSRQESTTAVVSGFQARVALAIVLLSLATLVRFGSFETVSNVVARCLVGEALVQILFAIFTRSTSSVFLPYHVLISVLTIIGVFVQFPLKNIDQETGAVIAAVIALPFGVYQLYHGVLTTQLDYHLSSSYWTFAFESSPHSTNNNFALTNTSPLSVVVVLRVTQMMVQLLEIGGLDEPERKILSQARNHFLYRVRNSSSLRHKAIATELLFRVVAGLIMRRTAMRMTEPSGPVSTTLTFMERQFSNRLLEQSETFIKPLPKPLDPDSLVKWVTMTVSSLLLHKRLFKAIKAFQGGKLDPSIQATKYLSRFSILLYLTARYIITSTRRTHDDDNRRSPPRVYD